MQGAIGGLQLIEAVVVDVGWDQVAFGFNLSAIDKVLQVFLQNTGGAGGGEHNHVGVLFLIFAGDVIYHLFLRTPRQYVAIDDAGGNGGKVALPFIERITLK